MRDNTDSQKFARFCAILEPRGRDVAIIHSSSVALRRGPTNQDVTRGAESAISNRARERGGDKSEAVADVDISEVDTWSGPRFAANRLFTHGRVGNISSSTYQKLDRMISMMEHLLSSGEAQVNPAMDSSYSHNYGRYENSHYNNMNGVDEDVSVHTLTNLEVHEDIQMEDYLIETSDECEVFQIEPEIVIALNEGDNEMNIDVNSDKPEKPQIESEKDQLLVLVQPPTLPCTFGKPYKGVKVREHLRIFYTADTFVLDDPDTIDSFVLKVPD
ncbi:hypothetical protein Syun_009319 [Stephania yunnanensis]|uniref:Uncharacterized protein n=1 Tax=Stephania yunnanensis TaxID=152371 RepID=A0AAP0KFC4_9MAGN